MRAAKRATIIQGNRLRPLVSLFVPHFDLSNEMASTRSARRFTAFHPAGSLGVFHWPIFQLADVTTSFIGGCFQRLSLDDVLTPLGSDCFTTSHWRMFRCLGLADFSKGAIFFPPKRQLPLNGRSFSGHSESWQLRSTLEAQAS